MLSYRAFLDVFENPFQSSLLGMGQNIRIRFSVNFTKAKPVVHAEYGIKNLAFDWLQDALIVEKLKEIGLA